MGDLGCVGFFFRPTAGGFGLDPQFDRIPDHAGPCVDSEILAAEHGGRGEADRAPEWRQWVALDGVEFDIQHDLARDPMQCELAVDRSAIGCDRLDAGRYEFGGRVGAGIQEISRQRCFVPIAVAEIDPRQRHGGLQSRSVPLLRVEGQASGAAGDGADRFREPGVVDSEHHPCMYRVEVVTSRFGGDGVAAEQLESQEDCENAATGGQHGNGLLMGLLDSRRMAQDMPVWKCNEALHGDTCHRIQGEGCQKEFGAGP